MKRSICCLVVFVFALGMQANGKNGIKMDDRRGMCVPADVVIQPEISGRQMKAVKNIKR